MGLKFWWQEQSIRKFVECHRARDLVLSTLALHCIVVCKVSQSKGLGPLYIGIARHCIVVCKVSQSKGLGPLYIGIARHCIVVCKVSQSKGLGPLYITRTCLSCSSLRRAKINHFQEEELKFVT